MGKVWILTVSFFYMLLTIGSGWAWTVYDHRRLALRAKACIPLPLPVEKRCKNPVDLNLLYHSLTKGAAEPDKSVRNGGDGLSSPKHSFNPAYEANKAIWDPSIRFVLNKPNSEINAGRALIAIRDEIEKTRGFLRGLSCESRQGDYVKLYHSFGRLSHYPADLAGPLHAYSVGVNNSYHEGDMGSDGVWFKGLWDYGKAGMTAHGQLELFSGAAAQIDQLACRVKSPTDVAILAREKMRSYPSKHSQKYGYEGLMFDFHVETGNPMGEFTAATPFFKNIGQVQAQDALAGVLSAWQDALKDFQFPSNCQEEPDGDCESSTGGPGPGGDHPDDTVSVSTLPLPFSREEILKQSWDRLAVKKNKRALIWDWMQEYLVMEYHLGNIDEDSYRQLSQNYELTPETASDLFYEDYLATPDVAILSRGFALSMSDLIQNKLNEPIRRIHPVEFSPDAFKDYPVLIVPSGGLMGIENSNIFKASLEEYVKQGGTLIVFAQQHGYEFSALPVPQEPDGSVGTLSGYGWSEDQSCFLKAAYIEAWHPMLSGLTKNTPALHLDGYFTTYPSNAAVLLRRTANGRPALILYDYGMGRVIATSMYSDFALKQNQASPEEIALIRDMINWAKKPGELPEIRPGQTVSLDIDIRNHTAMDATSIKLLLFNLDRSAIISEQTVDHPVRAGQSALVRVDHATHPASPTGIYQLGYLLYDDRGRIIQPPGETDSGRFAISAPPKNPYQEGRLNLSIQSDSEIYAKDSPVTYTIIVFNDSETDKLITCKYEGISQSMHVPSGGSNLIAYSRKALLKLPHYSQWWDYLQVSFYDGNTYLGSSIKNVRVYPPAVDLRLQMEKEYYGRGETGTLTASIRNKNQVGQEVTVRLKISGKNSTVFSGSQKIVLAPAEVRSLSMDFQLPPDSPAGTYTAIVEIKQGDITLTGTGANFNVVQSLISVFPVLPEAIMDGTVIPFILENIGRINLSHGVLEVSFRDPGGEEIHFESKPFVLAMGEKKTLEVSVPVSPHKFGDYTLTYTQSDETRIGNPNAVILPNTIAVAPVFDKRSYRVRETASLEVAVMNKGRFDLEVLQVSVTVPEATYVEAQTISLKVHPGTRSLNFAIPLRETMLAGWHDVDIAVILPSGAGIVRRIPLHIPRPFLLVEKTGTARVTAGDNIRITVENTGGVDTSYVTEEATVRDDRGVRIFSGSSSGQVLAGEKRPLIDIPLHPQTLNGTVFLNIRIKDEKSGKRFSFSHPYEVTGLSARLETWTDKESYLKTEWSTGFGRIHNGPFGIESASLDLSVRKVGRRFSFFLPRKDSGVFGRPLDVAVGPDGSIYVADTWHDRIQKFSKDWTPETRWGHWGWKGGEFYRPAGVAVDPQGFIYVTDSNNHRIQKFDPDGKFITTWGWQGDQIGGFNYPSGIAAAADGSIYVVDTGNLRVQKFLGDGTFVTSWEYEGDIDYGMIYFPQRIAVGPDGLVYFADTRYSRIQIFAPDGTVSETWNIPPFQDNKFYELSGIAIGPDGSVYLTDINPESHRIRKFDAERNLVTKWEWESKSFGSWLFNGTAVAVGPDGEVYVADPEYNRIRKLDGGLNPIATWGHYGKEDDQFNAPYGIAIGEDRSIYVADTWNHRILRFDHDGNLIAKWGEDGRENGKFSYPYDVAVGPDGFVYVADTDNDRIQKFDADGNFITLWGGVGSAGELTTPYGIAVGHDGAVYVANSGRPRIHKYDANGNLLTAWGGFGSGSGQFIRLRRIAIGPDGSVFTVDSERVQKFDSQGNFITQWGGPGSEDGQFLSPFGIAVDQNGSVYVVDSYNHRIQQFDGDGNFIDKIGAYGVREGFFEDPQGIAIGPDGLIYITELGNHRLQRMSTGDQPEAHEQLVFHKKIPVDQSRETVKDYSIDIGRLNRSGKYHIKATLINTLRQAVSQAAYPFYVLEGDTALRFNADKKVYRPGEMVMVTGQIENRAALEAAGLTLTLHLKRRDVPPELILQESFNIPAAGIHLFTLATPAGAEGAVTLAGTVKQNDSILAEISDQYEVARPVVSVSVVAPETVGNEVFEIAVELKNRGAVEATVDCRVEGPEFIDSQTVVLSTEEAKTLRYPQQIRSDTRYTFSFSGDAEQLLVQNVSYGLAVSMRFGEGGPDLGLFPEGHVNIPLTLANTGQLAEPINVNISLSPLGLTQEKIYIVSPGGSLTDLLLFNLTEGTYRLRAVSQRPDADVEAFFSVRRERQVEMALSVEDQADGLIPVLIHLINSGYHEINGSLQVKVSPPGGSGEAVWSGEEPVAALQPAHSRLVRFEINPSAIPSGHYDLQVAFFDQGNRPVASGGLELEVRGPHFNLTQLPPHRTFPAGEEAGFIFTVKNTGHQEGSFELRFKSYDLIDSVRRERLQPGEEKTVEFGFLLPGDMEENDYFANFHLADPEAQGGEATEGQVKYRVSGVRLQVSAFLDKSHYKEGEKALLAIDVESVSSAVHSFFARANYGGFEAERPFDLHVSEKISFEIPLDRITGEKLFYGIYHGSGKSIHLNSIHIHPEGEGLTLTTNKEVYRPGEEVIVSLSGVEIGSLALSGPGGYKETIDFQGQAERRFVLPASMMAGTYFLRAELSAPEGKFFEAVYPFDVGGIQVKVLECRHDRGTYNSSDTIATSLTVASNTEIPAVLRFWGVDPTGQYTLAGEQHISLSSSENLRTAHRLPFRTSHSGMHRLVYGIYSGDLLLVSGSETFDVGEAVLLGLSTDRRDYPSGTEPVKVRASLLGSIDGELTLELDGNPIRQEAVSLDGPKAWVTEIQQTTPGYHTLRAVLIAGGLKSIRETGFSYGLKIAPRPGIEAIPAFLDFGRVILGEPSVQMISLSNTGNADLVIGMIALSGTGQGPFGLGNDHCSGKTLPPEGACTVDLLFTPDSPGQKDAFVSIPSNTPATPELALPISGEGATLLKVAADPENGGRISGAGIDCPGDCEEIFSTPDAAIELTASPAEGYQFARWSGDIADSQNPVVVNMSAHKNITASFSVHNLPPDYTLTATAGSGGIILPSGQVKVGHGGKHTFTMIPDPCHQIADVLVDGVSAGAVTSYQFENITADHAIHAVFKPSLLITKAIPDVKNILVWLNVSGDGNKNSPERALIEKAFLEAGVAYEIVLDKKDMGTELRNPSYTDIVILGDHHPLEDHAAEELREQVFSGKGIISSLFQRQSLDKELFGIKFSGRLPGGDYPIEILQSGLSDFRILQSSGKAVQVEALNPNEITGWILGSEKKKTIRLPGIIERKYGKGKVLFFAFDLGSSARSETEFGNLLRAALHHIHTPRETLEFFPGEFAPAEIGFQSAGEYLILRVTETWPREIEIFDPATERWIRETPWSSQLALPPGMAERIFFYVVAPDRSGAYPFKTEVECLQHGKYYFYQDLAKEILIEKDAERALADILSQLSGLRVFGRERAKVNQAMDRLNQILRRSIVHQKEIEKNIDDLLKAVNYLLEVASVDLSPIRLKMDFLLRMWEGRWYFFE